MHLPMQSNSFYFINAFYINIVMIQAVLLIVNA